MILINITIFLSYNELKRAKYNGFSFLSKLEYCLNYLCKISADKLFWTSCKNSGKMDFKVAIFQIILLHNNNFLNKNSILYT